MRRLLAASLAFAVTAVAACSSSDNPTGGNGDENGGAATSVAAVSGSGQRVMTGVAFHDPLVVKVTNAQGAGVSGVSVAWAVTGGGGSVSAGATATNSSGEASVTLTAGAMVADNTVTATADGLSGSPVTFTAAGVMASAIAQVSGSGQSARTSQPLAGEFVVSVTAADNDVVPGATVEWAVTGGAGSLSAASTTTDAQGRTSVRLTLGSAAGNNAASATIAPMPSLTTGFSADGSAPVSVTVNMANIAFVAPGGGDVVTIMLGDTVIWVNQDAVQHTATSTNTPAGGTSFASGTFSQGASFRYTPDVRGDWVYFCEVHPTIMRDARIIVE